VGGKIYVVGGERELEVYDPAADRWSRGASIARALHHAAAVGLNDKPYVVGGRGLATDDVHEYDPGERPVARLAALPTPRGALAAAVLGGRSTQLVAAAGGAATPNQQDAESRPSLFAFAHARRAQSNASKRAKQIGRQGSASRNAGRLRLKSEL
jgi:hypothetical protein